MALVLAQPNDRTLALLESQFQALQNMTGHWAFFTGLADYVKAVTETPALTRHIAVLEKQQRAAERLFASLDLRALNEAQKAAERVFAVVNAANLNLEPIRRAMADLQSVMSGTTYAASRIGLYTNQLFDVARFLKGAGHGNLVREFEVQNIPPKNVYGDFVFAPSLDARNEEEERVKLARKTELWGAWENMPIVAELVTDPDGLEARLKEGAGTDPVKKWELFSFYGVKGELNRIRENADVRDDDLVFFRMADFKNAATRIQAFLVRRVLAADSDADTAPVGPEFDEQESSLCFAGKTILISRGRNSDPHELLKVIFSDKHKTWTCGEVLDAWQFDRDPTKVPKNKAYHAALAVNRKVAEQTTIADFLIVTTKEVRINPQYLPQTPK